MADWFITVESRLDDDTRPAVVYECAEYRRAVALANTLRERHPDRYVELVDFEGRIVLTPGLDRWDGTRGRCTIPLRAGVYRWQDVSETYRLVSL